MSNIERYDWADCATHLNHVIVRMSDGYAIIGDSPDAYYLVRYESIAEAKQAIDAMYISDLVLDLLITAASRNIISQKQREELSSLLDDQYGDDAANLQKVIQKYSFFQRLQVS
jgi:hypothetical protein